MRTLKSFLFAAAIAGVFAAPPMFAQEATLEEVIVEAPFDVRLELPRESTVQTMIARLKLQAENQRALDLQIANQTPVSRVLDLTRFIGIPLGSSEDRVDTFFLQNSIRADLNPRKSNPLFDEQ